MIPFFFFDIIHLGPFIIHVWGFFVALGIFFGVWVSACRAKKMDLDADRLWDMATWVIVSALIFARLFHLLYEPAYYAAHPFEIFAIWKGGLSIAGGFIGAVLVGIWFLHRHHLPLVRFADAAIFGVPLGIGIGRIGCFLTHQHPGIFTRFFLGVRYPDGPRHDLGLYLSLEGFFLFFLFLWMQKKHVRAGSFAIVFLLWEGTIRFILDFLRAYEGPIVDTRYFGLTPAQYVSLAMVVAGVVFMYRSKNLLAHQRRDG